MRFQCVNVLMVLSICAFAHLRENTGRRYAPGTESLGGYEKSSQCRKYCHQRGNLLPKALRFQHGGAKLASFPGRHLTSVRPWYEWLENTTRLHTFIPDIGTQPPRMTLPRTAWIRLYHLCTGVGHFRSCLHIWGMAPPAACECNADEQIVDHVVLHCPIHRPPHGLHGLTVLDDETIKWLLNTCPRYSAAKQWITTRSNDEQYYGFQKKKNILPKNMRVSGWQVMAKKHKLIS